jgi:hypothetical protein
MNVSSTINQNYLLKSSKQIDRLFCLAQCNLDDECMTTAYSNILSRFNNCFLYKKYFASNELTTSNGSNLYKKYSKTII